MSLKQKAISSVRWTSMAMITKSGLQFLQVSILARLLLPSDFGLMAMVVAIIGFVGVFSDMGVSNAIIHHRDISPEQLSSLYWLNLLASTFLGLSLAALSPWLAHWYQAPSLRPLLVLMSLFFVLTAIGQQFRVLAEKQLRFSVLAKIEISSALCGFVTAIVLAFAGAGVWALVIALLVSAALTSVLAWCLLANGWRPLWCLHWGEIKSFVRFGLYLIGSNLMNALNSNLDVLLGGRLLGTSTLGAYSLPRELSLRLAGVINPIITRVSLPVMAHSQQQPEVLRIVYLQTIGMSTAVNFPLYVAMAVFAPEVVALFFGPKWGESVSLLRILALWGMFRSVGNPVGSLIYAVGRADLSWKWNSALLFFIAPTVWYGAQSGTAGLSLALLVFMIAAQLPNWYFLVQPLCGAGFLDYFRPIALALICSGIAVGLAYVICTPFSHPLVRLSIASLAGALLYILCSFAINRPFIDNLCTLLRRERSMA
jgi:O-antigen/teichoic acid export membrane protein